MTGTPWHVETLKMSEDDERRHKSRCIYYCKSNKNCNRRRNFKCPGSAHCNYYKEDPTRIRAVPSTQSSNSVYRPRTAVAAANQIKAPKANVSKIDYDGTILYPMGCHVRHKTHGLGIVSKVEKEYVTVDFDEGFSKELSVEYCVKNSLLIREITEEEIRLAREKEETERRLAQEKAEAERKAKEALRQQESKRKEEPLPANKHTITDAKISESKVSEQNIAACSVNTKSVSTKVNVSPSESKKHVSVGLIVGIILSALILLAAFIYFLSELVFVG